MRRMNSKQYLLNFTVELWYEYVKYYQKGHKTNLHKKYKLKLNQYSGMSSSNRAEGNDKGIKGESHLSHMYMWCAMVYYCE